MAPRIKTIEGNLRNEYDVIMESRLVEAGRNVVFVFCKFRPQSKFNNTYNQSTGQLHYLAENLRHTNSIKLYQVKQARVKCCVTVIGKKLTLS